MRSAKARGAVWQVSGLWFVSTQATILNITQFLDYWASPLYPIHCEQTSRQKEHFDFSNIIVLVAPTMHMPVQKREVPSSKFSAPSWFLFCSKKARLSNFYFSFLAFRSNLNKTQNWSLWTYSMLLTSCPSAHIPSRSMATSVWQFSFLVH